MYQSKSYLDSVTSENANHLRRQKFIIKRNIFHHICIALKDIIIPDSVKYIEDNALSGCMSLVNLNIHNSVLKVGDYTFAGCASLIRIILPDSLN